MRCRVEPETQEDFIFINDSGLCYEIYCLSLPVYTVAAVVKAMYKNLFRNFFKTKSLSLHPFFSFNKTVMRNVRPNYFP
jgi:hypothetical protein